MHNAALLWRFSFNFNFSIQLDPHTRRYVCFACFLLRVCVRSVCCVRALCLCCLSSMNFRVRVRACVRVLLVFVCFCLFLFLFLFFVFCLYLRGFAFIMFDSEARTTEPCPIFFWLLMRSMLMQHRPVLCKTKVGK